MSTAPEPAPVEEFGPYLIYERLGMGGMATVYRAKKRGIAGYERSVALKRMLSHLADDPGFVDSFVREAKVASLLVHPNVAQVYDFGRINGVYYIAMELITGFDLRKLLRHANRTNEAIPLAVILTILVEMLAALEYAHGFVDEQGQALGIVHRDVSPSNLIIAHTGHVKVIDFGIAKAQARSLRTDSGQVKGKLGYMSPEAAMGMSVGAASDVFSAGVVAWELITAAPLFSARTDFETMLRIRELVVPPPSQYNPASPPELDQLVLAALDRDVSRRLPTAGLMRAHLEAIAARAGLHLSPRTLAEWLQQLPDDGHTRRGSMPASSPMIPVPGRETLRRTAEEHQQAAEIWGLDAQTGGGAGGSGGAAGANVSDQPVSGVRAYDPPTTKAVPTTKLRIGTPGAAAAPVAPVAVTPTAAPPRSRRGLMIALSVLLVGAFVMIGYFVWRLRNEKLRPQPASVVMDAGGGSASSGSAVAVATIPVDAGTAVTTPTPTVTPTPMPVTPTPTPTPTPPPPVTPTPHHPQHVEHSALHVSNGSDGSGAPVTPIAPTPTPVTPIPVTPIPVTPTPVTPTPVTPTPTKPTRVPVVAANAVTKLSGDLPQLQVHGSDTNGDVLAKVCIDETGRVSSVKVLKSPAEIAASLQQAMLAWRYKPYAQDGAALAVCFALSMHVVVQRAD